MNYEDDLEFCEYNPASIESHQELQALAKLIEIPAVDFLKKLMKSIVCFGSVE